MLKASAQSATLHSRLNFGRNVVGSTHRRQRLVTHGRRTSQSKCFSVTVLVDRPSAELPTIESLPPHGHAVLVLAIVLRFTISDNPRVVPRDLLGGHEIVHLVGASHAVIVRTTKLSREQRKRGVYGEPWATRLGRCTRNAAPTGSRMWLAGTISRGHPVAPRGSSRRSYAWSVSSSSARFGGESGTTPASRTNRPGVSGAAIG